MKKIYTTIVVIFVMALGLLVPSLSQSAPTMVTSRAALAGNDFIDWGDFGPAFTIVPSPSDINSDAGNVTTVSNPSNDFERRDQGFGWNGNFAPGDKLLFTDSTPGPMVIEFDVPVLGAGAQIQGDFNGAFTATLEAYDESNTLIASFSLIGNSTGAADNSAIFLGIRETTPIIKRIEYNVDNVTQDFAINQLDLVAPAADLQELVNKKGKFTFYYSPKTLVNVDSASLVFNLLKEPGTIFPLPCNKDVKVTIDVNTPSGILQLFTQTVRAGSAQTCGSKYRFTSGARGINDLVFEPVPDPGRVYGYLLINKTNFLSSIRASLTPAQYLAFIRAIDSYTLTVQINGDTALGDASLIKGTLTEHKQELIVAP